MNILIIAEGATSRSLIRNRDADQMQLSVLADAAKKSLNLGVTNLSILDLMDNRLDSLDRLDIIKIIESQQENISRKLFIVIILVMSILTTEFYMKLWLRHVALCLINL